MPITPTKKIWMDGKFVDWPDAKVHVLTHGLHYGTGVFEGIRAYETPAGTAVFRHREHLERLFQSAELYYMPIPFTLAELQGATHELIRANELRECYIRPIVFRGYGQMGLYPLDAPVEIVSRPKRSHSRAASSTALWSPIPHRGPRANRLSYSRRTSPFWLA